MSQSGGPNGKTPIDPNVTLGEFLRHERESRGIMIEQVASATKISIRSLHALEADHYADLPAKPFIRGFVTSYARFINLDPQEILTRFGKFIDEKALERPKKDSGHEGYAFEKKDGDQSRRLLWIIMGTFTVLGVIALILKPSLRGGRHKHIEQLRSATSPATSPSPSASPAPHAGPTAVASPTPSVTPQTSPSPIESAKPLPLLPVVVPSPRVTPPVAPAPAPAPSTAPSPVASEKPDPLNSGVNLPSSAIKQKVVIEALEDVWVRYRCDERPIMKFPLRKGRSLVLRGEKQITLQFSNPDAIKIRTSPRGGGSPRDDQSLTSIAKTNTLVYPAQALETARQALKDEGALPLTPGPSPAP